MMRRLIWILSFVLLAGCEAGYVVTIYAESGLLDELDGFGVSVAGWNQGSENGELSSPQTQCFTADDLPLTVGVQAGDEYQESAAIRVEVWRSDELWFIHEELLIFGEGKDTHSLRLSDECASCDGGFCSDQTGCISESPLGIFGRSPDDFGSLCAPAGP